MNIVEKDLGREQALFSILTDDENQYAQLAIIQRGMQARGEHLTHSGVYDEVSTHIERVLRRLEDPKLNNDINVAKAIVNAALKIGKK